MAGLIEQESSSGPLLEASALRTDELELSESSFKSGFTRKTDDSPKDERLRSNIIIIGDQGAKGAKGGGRETGPGRAAGGGELGADGGPRGVDGRARREPKGVGAGKGSQGGAMGRQGAMGELGANGGRREAGGGAGGRGSQGS